MSIFKFFTDPVSKTISKVADKIATDKNLIEQDDLKYLLAAQEKRDWLVNTIYLFAIYFLFGDWILYKLGLLSESQLKDNLKIQDEYLLTLFDNFFTNGLGHAILALLGLRHITDSIVKAYLGQKLATRKKFDNQND